ncbi:Succinyl-CoA:(R)-benzylsuccinate CoA-transferase subunit BbsE (plasmid) [Variovorax sp. SRS16]|uniref:CaiB/BaiF CoA transferase family protein n=1 Tax=Variovorax sp. SRS16 TaxID=282217 RepID=UPI001317000B|nr:CaiB/BaiF CoA-transferase family protein [Variovorax sp. SRS16]VTU46293.1 Succinyl-CoA:(R)-benzylsuccinate CoA-transferase subunit BbsE [Variovorax sp. SRS16]
MKPLQDVRVVEFEAPGPVTWAGMMLSDLGAQVTRIARPSSDGPWAEPLLRGRTNVAADLKDAAQRDDALRIVAQSDILLEGLRPGVMERLGLGPKECFAQQPRLVYGRMTGWGQTGPLAQVVGHDINFLALTGALHAIGPRDAPAVPLNLVGDFGGGAMLLLVGALSALNQARAPGGEGSVVDAAMVDGTLALMASTFARLQQGRWIDARESNLVDGGAPFYRTYRTSDDKFVAVGSIEPRFYAALLRGLALDAATLPEQNDRAQWPQLHESFAQAFASHPRQHWVSVFAGTDACVTPVLSLAELASDPHLIARGSFVERRGLLQTAPVPRFSKASDVTDG